MRSIFHQLELSPIHHTMPVILISITLFRWVDKDRFDHWRAVFIIILVASTQARRALIIVQYRDYARVEIVFLVTYRLAAQLTAVVSDVLVWGGEFVAGCFQLFLFCGLVDVFVVADG